MHQSTDEEPGGFKDRERNRPNAAHTRQTLSAVGRVASRVRNSGMSKLTKANSFLQRQKDDEQSGVNESPWGVGASAVLTVEKNLSCESRQSNDIDKLPISPSGEGAADVVELSSPLSADQYSPLRLSESTAQRSMKGGESPRKEHTGERIGQHRIESDRKIEKRNERTSVVLHAAGAARGLRKSVSKFGFRNNDRKSNTPEGALNDLSKAKSAMVLPVVDLKDTKAWKQLKSKRASDAEDPKRQRASAAEDDSCGALSQDDAVSDTKMRAFFIPGLGRKSKLGGDKSRNRTGLPQSTSNAHSISPKTNSNGGESPVNGPDSELSNDGKKTRKKKGSKDVEQKMRKGRASWFGFPTDSGDSQTRGIPIVGKGKSRTRRQRSVSEHEIEPEFGSQVSGKASKDLSDMRDFAVDEYFDSEEDDMETGSAPRSMAEDDFITYQTGKGKKTQGNKNRMKPQT